MKSLQEQYNLIKEGKGHKDVFLKEAKSRFPNMLTNSMNFSEAEKILTNRSVIQENYVDLKPIQKIENLNGPKKDFELAFEKFLSEGEDQLSPIINDTGKPNSMEIKTPAESKAKFSINDNGTGQFKENKEVENSLDNQYPYSPSENNINNVSGQELINGVYYECKANPELGLREAQELVVKNLSKDPLHYVKEGQFGEAIGYQTENGGMKKNKGETYGGSGYSEKLEDSKNYYEVVKENRNKFKKLIKESLGGIVTSGNPNSLAAMSGEVIRQMMAEDEGTNVSYKDTDVALEARQKAIENSQENAGMEEADKPDFPDIDGDGDTEESMKKAAKDKKKKMKKESIDSKLAEIGKEAETIKMEAQLNFLHDHIQEKIDRISSINEDDNLKELVDKSKMKQMQREIKLLEKRRSKMEKLYEKHCGSAYKRKEMVDEDSNANSNYGSNNGSNENSNDNPAVGQSYSGLEKYRQGVNEEEVDESFDSLAKKLDKQKGVDKEYAGKIAGKIANIKRKGGGKGPTAKQKKRMKEDNPVNWNDKNNPTKGPSGERDPRQVGQSVSSYSTTR
jgi:hypothetical protein|tara:strand:+ start:506 stop:2200 length:1695 start_codon:yes stop_codon:yes gene_type:complete